VTRGSLCCNVTAYGYPCIHMCCRVNSPPPPDLAYKQRLCLRRGKACWNAFTALISREQHMFVASPPLPYSFLRPIPVIAQFLRRLLLVPKGSLSEWSALPSVELHSSSRNVLLMRVKLKPTDSVAGGVVSCAEVISTFRRGLL
jgi:hypothetical protein